MLQTNGAFTGITVNGADWAMRHDRCSSLTVARFCDTIRLDKRGFYYDRVGDEVYHA